MTNSTYRSSDEVEAEFMSRIEDPNATPAEVVLAVLERISWEGDYPPHFWNAVIGPGLEAARKLA